MMRPEYWTNSEIEPTQNFSSPKDNLSLSLQAWRQLQAIESMRDSHLMDQWIARSLTRIWRRNASRQILSTMLDAAEIPLDPTTHWRQTLN